MPLAPRSWPHAAPSIKIPSAGKWEQLPPAPTGARKQASALVLVFPQLAQLRRTLVFSSRCANPFPLLEMVARATVWPLWEGFRVHPPGEGPRISPSRGHPRAPTAQKRKGRWLWCLEHRLPAQALPVPLPVCCSSRAQSAGSPG